MISPALLLHAPSDSATHHTLIADARSMPALRFIATITALTCLLGIALDLVTAHIWVDYFTVHHPKVVNSTSPTVMAFVWGIGASWWFGAIAAAILWVFNRRRRNPAPERLLVRWVIRSLVALWVTMMVILATTYGLIGLLPAEARRPTFDTDRRAMAVAITHMTEYALGAVVLVVLMILVGRRSRKLAQANPPHGKEQAGSGRI